MRLRLGERAPPHAALVAFALVSTGVLAIARVLPPGGLPLPTCLLKALTGLPCFACGATRTFVHLAHGRFAEGLRLSPGAALLALVAAATVLTALARLTILGRRVHVEASPTDLPRLRILAVVGLAAHWAWLVVHGA